MKNHMKSKQSSGFTLVETLATVAILVILLAVSAVSVAKHIDVLKITKLDNAAREIYMAAENRAVLLSAAQRLDDLVPMDDGKDGKEGNKVTPLTTRSAGQDDSLYYVSKANLTGDTKDLLLDGSVDSALLEGDFYIVYDMASGSVSDVFYAEKAGALTAIVDKIGFGDFYEKCVQDRSVRLDKEKTYGTLVGRYSGEAADGAAPWKEGAGTDIQEKPYINVAITNKEELTVTVTVKWDPSIDGAVRSAINGNNLSVMLNDTELAGNSTYYNLIEIGNGRVRSKTDLADGNTYECTWVLDSLKNKDLRFSALGSDITPGKDFTVKASIEPVKKDDINYSFIAAKAEATNNSLFEFVSDEGEAHIAYLRHLQNLSTEFSGVNEKDTTITSAVQTAHIWGDGNGGYKKIPEPASIAEPASGSGHVQVERNPYYKDYKFIPIVNEKLTSYSGLYSYEYEDKTLTSQYEIRELTVSGNDYVGLFGQNSESCTIQNVIMVDGSVTGGYYVGGIVGYNTGAVKNCSVSGSVMGTGNYIGGIVGYNNKGTVENCSYDDSDTVETGENTVKGFADAGGIVGYNNGGIVKKCVNFGHISIPNRGSRCGGIVGNNQSGAEVSDCVNSGRVIGGGQVGGIAGSSGDKGAVTNCYNTGAVKGNGNVGGVVGSNGDKGAVTNCYNTGAVKGNGNVGGVVGTNNLTVKNCYNIGEVSGRASVGGVAGTNTGTVQSCYYLETNDINKDLGGIGGEGEDGGARPLNKPQFATEDSFKGWNFTDDETTGIWTLVCPYEGEDTCPGYEDGMDLTRLSRPILKAIPEPDVPHAEGLTVGLVYFEDYGEDDYGVFGPDGNGNALNTLKTDSDTRTIEEFGYAVIVRADDVGSADAVTVRIDADTPVTSKKTEDGWKTVKANETTYYMIPLDALKPGDTAEENFYKYVNLGLKLGENSENKEVEGEYDYYFNPDFAKTVVDLTKEKLPENCESWSEDNAKQSYSDKLVVKPVEDGQEGETERKAESAIIIRTPEQLEKLSDSDLEYFSQGYAFKQELNLDLSSIDEQSPIGGAVPFKGLYDGGIYDEDGELIGGHTISGLNISGGNCVGLFGYSIGDIRNLTVNGTVTGHENVAGIVGSNGGTVQNCSFSGTVEGTESVGGVVGNNSGTVESCYNTGTVSGTGDYVGGVVGSIGSGTVKNCYNTGAVSGSSKVGGVAGNNSSTMENCYNIGEVSGTGNNVGGVAGYRSSGKTVTSCYYLDGTADEGIGGETGGTSPDGEAESKEAGDFGKQDTFDGWDNAIWTWDGGLWRPILSANPEKNVGDIIEINSPGALKEALQDALKDGGEVTLSGDITLDKDWESLGNSNGQAFKGTLDGNGHTITLNGSSLFAYNAGTIKNLHVVGTVTEGNQQDYYGGIVSHNDGTVENCSFSGSVTGGDKAKGVGGIVGLNTNKGKVINCYNIGEVSYTGNKGTAGGIAGENKGTVQNCYYQTTVINNGLNGIGNGTGDAINKSSEEFASGEVAYLLQEGNGGVNAELVWGQNLTNDPKDDYPVLGGPEVYDHGESANPRYSNTPSADSYALNGGPVAAKAALAPSGRDWEIDAILPDRRTLRDTRDTEPKPHKGSGGAGRAGPEFDDPDSEL